MKKISFEDALILKAIKLGRFCVRVLPLRVSFFVVHSIGAMICLFSKRGRIAYKNVRMIFAAEKTPAEMWRIARHSIENLASSAVDLLGIPEMNEAYVRRHIRILGTEKFEPYLKEGKGIIFLTAHFGSWELLNITAALIGYPMMVLARTQKHPRSDAFLTGLRTSKGSQVVTKGMPIREILQALKIGKIVGILGDQDAGRNGTFVDFLGLRSSFAPGAAAFSLKTQSPIFPVFIFREKSLNHRVEVEGPLVMPDPSLGPEEARHFLVQQFASILESKIRKSPDQWLWAHRRWKSTPDKSVLILSDQKAGHLNQSLEVLEAIKRERQKRGFSEENLRSKIINVRYKNSFTKFLLKSALLIFGKRLGFKRHWLKFVLTSDAYREIISCYADIVISCGSQVAPINFLAKDENQAKNVVVMKPGLSLKLFDAALVPWHDKIKPSANALTIEGALASSPLRNASGTARLAGEISLDAKKTKIGLLLGGDAGRFKYDRGLLEGALREILAAASESDAEILATSSRRTPLWAEALIETLFCDKRCCPLLVLPRRANRPGVVQEILGLCGIVVVSGESMSMVSEAVASGKRVVVFIPSSGGGLKKKHREFLKHWEEEKYITIAKSGGLFEVLARPPEAKSGSFGFILPNNQEILDEAVRRVL